MSSFSESQIQDLRDLQRAIRELGAEAVIIGAMAYRVFIEDSGRETYDIDLAVALDLDEFRQLEDALVALGWSQLKTQEQRWVTRAGTGSIWSLPVKVFASRESWYGRAAASS